LATDLNHQRIDSAFILQRELNEKNAALELMNIVNEWSGRLDLLVNNACVFARTDCANFNEADWSIIFETNVKVPFLLILAARPLLSQHSGAIINITDIHGERPLQGYSLYCQSKAALEMQTKTLAREFSPTVRVNSVAPGATLWPENANALSRAEQQKILDKTPLTNHGNPEYLAQAVLALAENPFITGQTLKVDGGRSLMG
jgi:pteridine reductase